VGEHTTDQRRDRPQGSATAARRVLPSVGPTGSLEASLLTLQRTAGNRAAVASRPAPPAPPATGRAVTPAGGPSLQRVLGSGYYVVCGPDEDGALLIANDKAVPKRYYRTVASLGPKATKAPLQPFSFWNLWLDPDAVALPPKPIGEEETDEQQDEQDPDQEVQQNDDEQEDDEQEADEPEGGVQGEGAPKSKAERNRAKRAREKKKKAEKKKVPPAHEPKAEGPAKEAPPEEAWKVKYMATSKLEMGMRKQNMAHLEKEFKLRAKDLAAQVAKLEPVWLPEMGGDPPVTLEERQAELGRAPVWDGNDATLLKHLGAWGTAIEQAKDQVAEATALSSLAKVISQEQLTELLATFTPATVRVWVNAVTEERLRALLVDHLVPPPALAHYGPKLMRGFVGAGSGLWAHLVNVELNAKGVVSGGHDEAVFTAFIKKKGYTVTNTVAGDPVSKVTYKNKDGSVTGSKTLIKNLTGTKDTWMPRFNRAVWKAVAAQALSDGRFTTSDDAGQTYEGFYDRGSFEVTSMWPT
jgi:hypothetical protein